MFIFLSHLLNPSFVIVYNHHVKLKILTIVAAMGFAAVSRADQVKGWTCRHARFVEVQLMDATDFHNELWSEKDYLLFGR